MIINDPNRKNYIIPTNELQSTIKHNTMIGFWSTIVIISILSFLYFLIPESEIDHSNKEHNIPTGIEVVCIDEKDVINEKIENPLSTKSIENIINIGIDEVSGIIEIVRDKLITSNLPEFVSFDKMEFAFNKPGDGVNFVKEKTVHFVQDVQKQQHTESNQIDDDIIFSVEQAPECDMDELQRNIIYPEFAKKIEAEGKVVVKAIIGTEGKVLSTMIIQSTHEVLEKAAIDAIIKTKFTPAIQNGNIVVCPVYIPVVFKLR